MFYGILSEGSGSGKIFFRKNLHCSTVRPYPYPGEVEGRSKDTTHFARKVSHLIHTLYSLPLSLSIGVKFHSNLELVSLEPNEFGF